jgi:hypothetical protein
VQQGVSIEHQAEILRGIDRIAARARLRKKARGERALRARRGDASNLGARPSPRRAPPLGRRAARAAPLRSEARARSSSLRLSPPRRPQRATRRRGAPGHVRPSQMPRSRGPSSARLPVRPLPRGARSFLPGLRFVLFCFVLFAAAAALPGRAAPAL